MDIGSWSTYAINAAARELAGAGIRLGHHHHHFEWARLPDGAVAFDVLWDLLDPEILAEVDVYWAAVAGQDPAEVLDRLGERAVAAHLKDGPARRDTPQTPSAPGKPTSRPHCAREPDSAGTSRRSTGPIPTASNCSRPTGRPSRRAA
ncbi:sugar phosphate isomerase/epimerase family protein [Streptomyces scabiei]|uniref:sugar phosphate isomerase/epimerase family protein n=1 Tax=Streptomyces scabiei TaxID=1930 RepID=UPI0006904F38|nr:sugar phosphate isomerase/epimerase [Streptomyces scabiei]